MTIILCLGRDEADGDWVVELHDRESDAVVAEVHAADHDRALELAQLEIVRLTCDE